MKRLILASTCCVALCVPFEGASANVIASFGYSGAVTTFTASANGTYEIVAIGAQGGHGAQGGEGGSANGVGGRGALVGGSFFLTAGETLSIAVGGAGASGSGNGGGGGSSFIVGPGNTPLLIAGGGGGIRADAGQNGWDASITTAATFGCGYRSSCAFPGYNTAGIGQGGGAPSSSWGSGGGGFNSDGASDVNGEGGFWGIGGSSWFNGLAGGVDISCSAGGNGGNGGFGGGGAGAGCDGGGGGGGYSGGDGGYIAGGGGSYNASDIPFAIAGVGCGNGSVVIGTDLSLPTGPAPCNAPEPASLSLVGLAP